jgi:hypothetical protein
MSEFFTRIGQWLADYQAQVDLPAWLYDLIQPIIDLFANLASL